MPFISWDNKFSVKVLELDEQHRKLIDLINEFYDGMGKIENKKVLDKVLLELLHFSEYHFSSEEEYLHDNNYPTDLLREQVQQHREFSKTIKKFVHRFGSNESVPFVEVTNYLKKWLIEHMLDMDQKYAQYFNP
ncbi:bacteriohemerythrin [Candidatus Woesearchaeota archaeon]|nr:bacteriohemerythrin [Candidatus Woesearchaeota archaeon]